MLIRLLGRVVANLADVADRHLFPMPDIPPYDCGIGSDLMCECGFDPLACLCPSALPATVDAADRPGARHAGAPTSPGPDGSQTDGSTGEEVGLPGDDSGAGEACIRVGCDELGVIPVNYELSDSRLYCADCFAAYGDVDGLLNAAADDIELLDLIRVRYLRADMAQPSLSRHRLIAALRALTVH